MITPPETQAEKDFMAQVASHRRIGYGRMIQMISELWRDLHGDGALYANDTYSSLQKKRERCAREGHDPSPGTCYDWCDRCGQRLAKKEA
jgi:hypothetical protein